MKVETSFHFPSLKKWLKDWKKTKSKKDTKSEKGGMLFFGFSVFFFNFFCRPVKPSKWCYIWFLWCLQTLMVLVYNHISIFSIMNKIFFEFGGDAFLRIFRPHEKMCRIHKNVQNLTADSNLVNKSWFGQEKVNILIIHQNVQNLTADPNLVNKLWFWSTKGQQSHNTSKKCFFIKATGGWVGFFTWRFLWMLPKRLSKGNWRVGGLFYLTFSLNSSKTIIFDIFLDLPLLNDEYECVFWRKKGIGANGPPLCAREKIREQLVTFQHNIWTSQQSK